MTPQIVWVLDPLEVASCIVGLVCLGPFILYALYRYMKDNR